MIANILVGVFITAILVLLAAIVGPLFTFIPFLLAWNFAIVPVFDAPYLDWTQAFAILVVVFAIGSAFKTNTSK